MMVVFVFKIKTVAHVKENGSAVEKIVTIFQKKRKVGMRVQSCCYVLKSFDSNGPFNVLILVSHRR